VSRFWPTANRAIIDIDDARSDSSQPNDIEPRALDLCLLTGNRVQIRGRLQRREHRHLIDLRGSTRLGTIVQAGDPASVYRFFKTITVCSDTPTRSTISFIPTPSSANNTIRARGTKPARNNGVRVHRINSARSSAGTCTATVNGMHAQTGE
jgi:hypothetical protein